MRVPAPLFRRKGRCAADAGDPCRAGRGGLLRRCGALAFRAEQKSCRSAFPGDPVPDRPVFCRGEHDPQRVYDVYVPRESDLRGGQCPRKLPGRVPEEPSARGAAISSVSAAWLSCGRSIPVPQKGGAERNRGEAAGNKNNTGACRGNHGSTRGGAADFSGDPSDRLRHEPDPQRPGRGALRGAVQLQRGGGDLRPSDGGTAGCGVQSLRPSGDGVLRSRLRTDSIARGCGDGIECSDSIERSHCFRRGDSIGRSSGGAGVRGQRDGARSLRGSAAQYKGAGRADTVHQFPDAFETEPLHRTVPRKEPDPHLCGGLLRPLYPSGTYADALASHAQRYLF